MPFPVRTSHSVAAKRGLWILSLMGSLVLHAEPTHRVFPDRKLQVIQGIGFEIQSDSIGSGNNGLPEDRTAVPHDLTEPERQRFFAEMLKGFRYCRLAGGLYWRGLDEEKKQLRPRWPDQLKEIREMMTAAGIEGVSFEYWSPPPFWKANQRYIGEKKDDPANTLRCFAPGFDKDPIYQGDERRFLTDFAAAVVTDIRTLKDAGIHVSMWGLQNEPFISNTQYPTCHYPDAGSYVKAYQAVASEVRKLDPEILLISDTETNFPSKIATGMNDPAVAALVDAYVVHTIGAPSEQVAGTHARIRKELPLRPWFQNEYEYLEGGATPERCLNTVQHIMNSFQLAENPTWFWLHALKPFKNAEASGYSLGFWKPSNEVKSPPVADDFHRWTDGPAITDLPDAFRKMEMIVPARGDTAKPGSGYTFTINQDATLHMLVDRHGDHAPEGWQESPMVTRWNDRGDRVFTQRVKKGEIQIPAHTGKDGQTFGAPHAVFIEGSDPGTLHAMIGLNVPIVIRSEYQVLAREAAKMEPGSWIYNPHNWNAVGSFVKRLPWDSTALAVEESAPNKDARILAFVKPNGKRTVVVSNRTGADSRFSIDTGLPDSSWNGYRYTPTTAGPGTMGVPVGTRSGKLLDPVLPHLSWEFWEEQ